ncbi:MAG: hypothetical protein ABIQ49_04115 [Gemmatimonadales bacterium]
MFLGHYGVAFAIKRLEPKISLGTLFVATQLVDLLWGAFLLLGWEHVRVLPDDNPLLRLQFYDYPISHSLVGAVGWGAVAAALYYSWPTRDTTRHWQASALVGAIVASHWLLDLVVHLGDLPLAGNDTTKLGLGLWRHFGASVGLELLLLGGGLALYLTSRSRRHPVRPVALGLVLLLLLGAYAAALFGPPPPSVTAIAVTDIGFMLLMGALAAWADRAALPAELVTATGSTR